MTFKTELGTQAIYPNTSWLDAKDAVPEALILDTRVATQGPEIVGDFPTLHVPIALADPTAVITKEAEVIAESEAAFSELVINTSKISLLTSMSNESLTSSDGADLLSQGASRSMANKADAVFLNGDGANGTPKGISLYDDLTKVNSTDITADGLYPILDAIAAVTDNGGTPTSLLMRYSTWAKLLKLKGSDNRPLISPDVQTMAAPVLFGLPIILNRQVPADAVMVIDAANVIASVSQVSVATSDGALFAQDATALRMTQRIGFGLKFPNQCGLVTYTEKTGK